VDISSSFHYTPKMARQAFRACHPHGTLVRWLPAGIYLGLGILLLALAFRDAPDPRALVFGVVVLVLGLFGRQIFNVRRAARAVRALSESGTTRLELSDAGYTVEASGETISLPWPTFKSAALVRGFWVLTTESEGTLAFPSSALDAAQTESFRAVMREKGLLKR